LKIKDHKLYVDTISPRKATWTDLREDLDEFHPCYLGYDYEYTTRDGRAADKMFFILWMPENTSQFERIAYSQALANTKSQFSGSEYKDIETLDDLENLLSEEVIDPTRL
jgi:hypothetical protein